MFSLTDAPTNQAGKVLFYLDTEAVELIQKLLDNLVIHRIIPLLKTNCTTVLEESCALKTMTNLPWPEAAQQAVAEDIATSGRLVFSPQNFKQMLEEHLDSVDKGASRIILRAVQWVALCIYQAIYDYQLLISGRKKLIGSFLVLEAIREDEVLADILRGLVFLK